MPFDRFRVGIDYQPPRGWADFDAVRMAEDFDFAAALGIDLLRVAVPWDFLCPSAERASPVALGKLLALLDLAGSRQMTVIPAILVGAPAYLGESSPWSDPAALRIQVRHVHQVGERFGANPAIAAWDLGGTPDRVWSLPRPDAAWLWVQTVGGELRRLAPQPLLLAFAGVPAPWEAVWEHVDLAGLALDAGAWGIGRYPFDPLVPAFRAALAAGQCGRPPVVTVFEPPGTEELPASFHRDAIEALWRAGAAAAFASFSLLRPGGAVRPHADDLAAVNSQRRPIQTAPSLPVVGAGRIEAQRAEALQDRFDDFAATAPANA